MNQSIDKVAITKFENILGDIMETCRMGSTIILVEKVSHYEITGSGRHMALAMHDNKDIVLKIVGSEEQVVLYLPKAQIDSFKKSCEKNCLKFEVKPATNKEVKKEDVKNESVKNTKKEVKNIKKEVEDEDDEDIDVDKIQTSESEVETKTAQKSTKNGNASDAEEELQEQEKNFLKGTNKKVDKKEVKVEKKEPKYTPKKISVNGFKFVLRQVEGEFIYYEDLTGLYCCLLPLGPKNKDIPYGIAYKNDKDKLCPLKKSTQDELKSNFKMRVITDVTISKLEKIKYDAKKIQVLKKYTKAEDTDEEELVDDSE